MSITNDPIRTRSFQHQPLEHQFTPIPLSIDRSWIHIHLVEVLIYHPVDSRHMAWFFGKKEEKPIENKRPEQSERQYNLYWMIRKSPFAEYTDEEIQEAIEKKIREVNRTLKTQPVEMVRVKSEKKVAKLEEISGKKDVIAAERDAAILHFNMNMADDNNGEVPQDMSKINAAISREGWADGTGLVNVDGMPHCAKCGYINRKAKLCVNCGAKLKF